MALRKEETVTRLTFGEDWIDVRTERLYRDTVLAQRAAASQVAAPEKGGEAAVIDFDVSAFNLCLLTRMITAWSDEEPVNEETVQNLPNVIIQEVLEVINEGRDEDEKVPLEKTSSSQSESPDESSPLPESPPPGQ